MFHLAQSSWGMMPSLCDRIFLNHILAAVSSTPDRRSSINYRLSRARRAVENAFGILVSRFRVSEKPIPLSLKTTEQMVKTACAMHNWLQKSASLENPGTQDQISQTPNWWERQASGQGMPGGTPSAFQTVYSGSMTNHSRAATQARDQYAESSMTTHSVTWQWQMI